MGEAIPAGWREVRLGDILVEQDERVGARTDLSPLSLTKAEGLVPARERFGKDLLGKDLSRYRVCRRDDFVVDPMLLWDGAVARLTRFEAGFVSPDYRVYRATEDVHAPFVSYLLSGPAAREAFANNAKGTNIRRNRISRDDFADVKLNIPPIAEQGLIADALLAVDAARHLSTRCVEVVRRARRTLLDSLLTAGRSTGTGSAGQISDDRPSLPLEALAQVRSGIAKNSNGTLADAVDVPYLRTANVQDGYIDLSEVKSMLVERADLKDLLLQDGDVLMIEGGDFDKVGRGAVWNAAVSPCVHQNHVFAVRCGPRLLPEFLSLLTESSLGKAYFRLCAKQTTNLASINMAQLRAFPVCLPPISVQQATVESLETVSEALRRDMAVASRLTTTKTALQQSLLSGRLRVKL